MIEFALLIVIAASVVQSERPNIETTPHVSYATSVGYHDSRCSFWTGDVGFDEKGFESDLRSRFDTRNGIVIYHAESVPDRCLKKAKRAAKRAGFNNISYRIGEVNLGVPR